MYRYDKTHLGVNAIRVVDGAIVLDDTDAGGTSADEVTAGVETHVTETLDDEGLATPSGSSAW